jgi:hypothetical protein
MITPEAAPATFHFDQVFLGAHLPNPASAALTELGFRIPALDRWLGISGLRIDPIQPWREISIHFVQPEDLEFELKPGLKLVFSFDYKGPTLTQPQLEVSLCQEVWLLLRASPPRQFAELRRVSNQMLDLFSLLVGEPLACGAMVAQPPTTRTGSPRRRSPGSIDILFQPVGAKFVDAVVEGHRMLLRFRDVQARLPEIFSRWLESCEVIQPALDVYFSMQRRDPGYQELRFLGLVRALESLHRLRSKDEPSPKHRDRLARILEPLSSRDRKWLKGKLSYSHEPTLAMRMTDLLKPFGGLFGEPERQQLFIEKVVDTRNYLTHYGPALRRRAVEPLKLLPYLFRLQVLFILHCLLELNYTSLDAREFIEKNDKLRQMVRFCRL